MKSLKLTPLSQPVQAKITIPGSKSYTNRALLIAALTPQPVKLINPLISDDTRAMVTCLQQLGIEVTSHQDNITVIGDISAVKDQDYEIDTDLSGTTIRFLLALCTVIPGRQTLRGKAELNKRPIGDLVDGLQHLGAKVEYLDQAGYPPLLITSSTLNSGVLKISGEQSSQYLSAILMVAPLIDGGLTIEVQGKLNSKPFVGMTIDTMKHFGVEVTESYVVRAGQKYSGSEYVVEGDVSSASYFAAIAALTGSTLTLKNLNPQSLQADMGFLKILESMGNEVTPGQDEITISGHSIKAVEVDMRDCPDQAQTLAVLAAFANGTTTITGVQSLRVKETERIVALEQELKKMGIKTSSTNGTLVIEGGQPQPASIATYGDHRMAMAFAVAGSKLAGMQIEDPAVVAKTFPDFWNKLASIGIETEDVA
jgi:3-phosphoshikimate 1-carboxyvinyltransferase